jgi:hypothetical protein
MRIVRKLDDEVTRMVQKSAGYYSDLLILINIFTEILRAAQQQPLNRLP